MLVTPATDGVVGCDMRVFACGAAALLTKKSASASIRVFARAACMAELLEGFHHLCFDLA